jgi:hypothetical protein
MITRSLGAGFTRTGTSSATVSIMDRNVGLTLSEPQATYRKAFAIPAAFWSMGFGNLALDLLR